MRDPGKQSSGGKAGPSGAAATREDRLKAALKANMARRKAQAKARSAKAGGDDGQDNDAGSGAG